MSKYFELGQNYRELTREQTSELFAGIYASTHTTFEKEVKATEQESGKTLTHFAIVQNKNWDACPSDEDLENDWVIVDSFYTARDDSCEHDLVEVIAKKGE